MLKTTRTLRLKAKLFAINLMTQTENLLQHWSGIGGNNVKVGFKEVGIHQFTILIRRTARRRLPYRFILVDDVIIINRIERNQTKRSVTTFQFRFQEAGRERPVLTSAAGRNGARSRTPR